MTIKSIINNVLTIFAIYINRKNHKESMKVENDIIEQNKKESSELKQAQKDLALHNCKPNFKLQLDEDRIKDLEAKDNDTETVEIVIELLNIGLGQANKIKFFTKDTLSTNYFSINSVHSNNYVLYNYLNQDFARVNESIKFSLLASKLKSEKEICNDVISFIIVFADNLGNIYKQNFKFTYYVNGSKRFCFLGESEAPSLQE